jgi:hypothetical protein
MRLLSTVPLTLAIALVGAPVETCADPALKQVEVTNFPDPQNVTGTVEVTNLPDVQDVHVTNTPLAVTLNATPLARYQFVGFSTSTFDGGQGVRTYTEACQADFSSSARMCTSEEVLNTVQWPAVPDSARGWVRPSYQPTSFSFLDASGVGPQGRANGELTCGGWSFSASTLYGLAVSGDGRFVTPGLNDSCDVARPIACCALIE